MKHLLLVALALTVTWSVTSPTPPAAAQDYSYDSSTLAQMGAMSTVNAHIAERAKRDAARNRRTRKSGYNRRTHKSRLSKSNRRTTPTYRTNRRTTSRSHR